MDHFTTAFLERQDTWHGIKEEIPKAPTSVDELLAASDLDWEVNTLPMIAAQNSAKISTPYKALVRSTDNEVLGVVKNRWTNYQNREAFEWAEPLIESGFWKYSSGGSFRKGRRCWMLLQQDEVEIVPNDALRQFLLVTWSHDGKTANYVQPTSIRIACENTLRAALKEEGVMRFAICHSSFVAFNMEQTKVLLNITTESFNAQREVFTNMAKKQITKKEVAEVLDNIFPLKNKDGSDVSMSAMKKRWVVEEAIEKGSGIQENGLAGTKYGVFVGISEAVEHFLGGSKITDRGENILLYRGRDIVDKAFRLLAA